MNIFNQLKWWGKREKQTDAGHQTPDTRLAKKAARDSKGTSKASREQKRQKKARMITRRNR